MPTNFKIVPANPGYYALDRICYKKQDRIEVQKVPVIAWRITLTEDEADILPICADGLSDLWKGEILTPDGDVFWRYCESWKSIKEFEDAINVKKHPDANHVQTTIMDRMSEPEVVSNE